MYSLTICNVIRLRQTQSVFMLLGKKMMTELRKAEKSTVQIENERVIVTEWRFNKMAGLKSPAIIMIPSLIRMIHG